MDEEEQQPTPPPPKKPSWILMTLVATMVWATNAFFTFFFGSGFIIDFLINVPTGIIFYFWLTWKGQKPGFWFWSLGGLQAIPVIGAIFSILPLWLGVVLASYLKSKSKVVRAIAGGTIDVKKMATNARTAGKAASWSAMRKSLKSQAGEGGTAAITDAMRASAKRRGDWAGKWAAGKSLVRDVAVAKAKMNTGVTTNAVLSGEVSWKKYADKMATDTIERAAGVRDEREPKAWSDLEKARVRARTA